MDVRLQDDVDAVGGPKLFRFQYLKGAIRGPSPTLGRVNSSTFNTSKARLEDAGDTVNGFPTSIFQYLKGAIRGPEASEQRSKMIYLSIPQRCD